MAVNAQKIVNEALLLPVPLRAYVAEKLKESLDAIDAEDLSPEWKEEVQRRCKEIDNGSDRLISTDVAFEKAYRALK
jgi:hypothetical protein